MSPERQAWLVEQLADAKSRGELTADRRGSRARRAKHDRDPKLPDAATIIGATLHGPWTNDTTDCLVLRVETADGWEFSCEIAGAALDIDEVP